jgi:6-phosphogluconolactonase (cycloisomerase 2 family)
MRRRVFVTLLLVGAAVVMGPRPASAQESTFVYVKGVPTNGFDDVVERFRFNTDGTTQFLGRTTIGDNSSFTGWPGQSMVTARGNLAPPVLVSGGIRGITVFTIARDGAITRVAGSPFAGNQTISEIQGVAVVHRRSRTFVYGAETARNRIRGFELFQNGALTELPTSPFASGPAPFALTSGDTYLYATGQRLMQNGSITAYRVMLDGTLSQPDGSPYYPGTTAMTHAVVDPSGQFVYAADRLRNRVFAYSRTNPNGALTSLKFRGISTGAFTPGHGLVQGSRDLAYAISDAATLPILSLRRDAAGILSPLGVPSLPGLHQITQGALDPTEAFLVLVDEFGGALSSLTVDRATGGLTPLKDTYLPLRGVTGLSFAIP